MPLWTCEVCQRTHQVREGSEEYRDCLQAGQRFQVAVHEGWTYAEDSDVALCPDHVLPFADEQGTLAEQR